MLRTTTVTQLRAELASLLESLQEGPLLVLSHSKPAAILIEPEMFESLVERVEFLEDLFDGRQAIAEYLEAMRAAVGDNREFWFPMDRKLRKDRALYLARELGSGLASYADAEIKKAMGA